MDYNIFNRNVNDVIADKELTVNNYTKERRERLEKCHRSRNGLLPAEILMIYYARSYTTDQTDFQAFWYYNYGVTNPSEILQKLSREGFIAESKPYENVVSLRVVDLKELLKKAGLKVSGRKQELIDRLLENVDEQFLNENIESRKYKLTEKGQTELNYNEYVIYFTETAVYTIYMA